MNLLELITNRIASFATEEEAAKFFKVTVTRVRKWYAGTEEPPLRCGQIVLDEEIKAGKIIPVAFAPDSAVKVAKSNQSITDGESAQNQQTPEDTAQPDYRASGIAASPVVATESAALVRMTPEELERELSVCMVGMPNENRATLLKMLADGLERKVTICLPTHSDINPTVFHSILGLSRNLRVAGLEMSKDTLIHRARNMLAERFLASNAEWSLWIDADMVVPFGNAKWFKSRTASKVADQFAGINALQRLTRDTEKTIVGGVYCARSLSRRLLIAPELDPAPNGDDRKIVSAIEKDGPSDKVIPVKWIAFGIAAVHRSVFEDIKAQMPELAPRRSGAPFNFFSMVTDDANQDIGEDKLFCIRAAKCGHQSHLDLAVHAAHVGNYPFLP